jgi:ERCC4-related helicase
MVDFHSELLGRCLNDHGKVPKKKKNFKFGKLQLTDDAQEVLGQDNNFDNQEKEEEGESEEEFDDIELLKLHGSMTQKDRMEVFKTFRDSASGVLLCTDVAARGLDLPQVDWIVQYNPPISKADYVHR